MTARLLRVVVGVVVLLGLFSSGGGSRYVVQRKHEEAQPNIKRGVAIRRLFSPSALFLLLAGTSAQMADIKRQFSMLDEDHDGIISREEYMRSAGRILDDLRIQDVEERARRLDEFHMRFDQADLNKDGAMDVSEAEYMAYLANEYESERRFGAKHDAENIKVFAEVDTDRDGKVSEAELLAMLAGTGDNKVEVKGQARQLFSESFAKSDLDGDGFLDFNEMKYANWNLQRLINQGLEFTEELTGVLFRDWDENRDGKIERPELDSALTKVRGNDPVAPAALRWARARFDEYDVDESGSWDREETSNFAGMLMKHINDMQS